MQDIPLTREGASHCSTESLGLLYGSIFNRCTILRFKGECGGGRGGGEGGRRGRSAMKSLLLSV